MRSKGVSKRHIESKMDLPLDKIEVSLLAGCAELV